MDSWKTLLSSLARLFPYAEFGLFDSAANEWVEIFNKLSVNQLDYQPPANGELSLKLSDGRAVRMATAAIPGQPYLHLRVLVDISQIEQVQQLLSVIAGGTPEASAPKQDGIAQFISSYLLAKQTTLAGLSRTQKRDLVFELHRNRLFELRDAAKQVADVLGISRATVYNYLNWAQRITKVQIHQVDTFTREKFSGNPAGVVLDAQALSDDLMRKIAREMNLSETAFVLPSEHGDFRLRYFTPTGDEVRFCGHSTVGALYMLAREERFGMRHTGKYQFSVETGAGLLLMQVSIKEDEEISVSFDAPLILMGRFEMEATALAEAVGIPFEFLDTRYPPLLEETNCDLFIAMRSLDELQSLQVDTRLMAAFCRQHEIVALCLYVKEAISENTDIHVRCFAPAVGIPEDPFTGSAMGGLVGCLVANKMIPKDQNVVRCEQGLEVGRPGSVSLRIKRGRKLHATIEAEAVHCFSTEIHLV